MSGPEFVQEQFEDMDPPDKESYEAWEREQERLASPNVPTLTIDCRCANSKGKEVPIGTVVEYLGHVTGGMVLIRWNGDQSVIHPHATKELRS